MKKIIIFLAVILFIIVILVIFLPFLLQGNNKKSIKQTVNQNNQPTNLSTGNSVQPTQTSLKVLENDSDFKVEYSPQGDQYVIIKKTPGSDQKINDWLIQNNLSSTKDKVQIIDQSEMAGNPEITIYPSGIILSPTKTADENAYDNNTKVLINLLSVLLNNSNETSITPSTSVSQPLTLTVTPTNKKNKKGSEQPAGKYVYYAQCGGEFDSYPLPSGCTICYAGCGPTTVSMIAASYIDKNITPKTIVDLYKQKGYLLGCAGSRASDAKSALSSYGVKTTDFMTFSYDTIDTAAKEFKNYVNNGWTIFILADFCDGGCGHFFWITEIGNNNDTWAYDPYYGRLQPPPYNEKSRYPFPKYRMAFGVKK